MKTYLPRLKKLLLICQMITISGCNQAQAAALPSSQTTPPTYPVVEQPVAFSRGLHPPWSDPNQDSDLWANIFHEDFADEASRLDIVANNNSQYNLEMIGCDERIYLQNKLTNIPAGYKFPITRDYDPGWKFLDPAGKGLFDRTQIERNSLVFSGTPQQDQFNCYYRVFVPAAGSSLYLKLVNNLYSASSYSPDGPPLLNRPYADKLLAEQSSSWLEIASPLAMDALAGALSYKYLIKRHPSFNPGEYLQSAMDESLYAWTNNLNELLTRLRHAYLAGDTSFDYQECMKAIDALIKVDLRANRYFRISDFKNFLEVASRPNADYLSAIKYYAGSNRFGLEFRSAQNRYLYTLNVNDHSHLVRGDPLPSPSVEIERLGLENDPEVFLKLFGRGKYLETDSEFAIEIVDLERMGLNSDEIISFGAANTAFDMVSLGLAAGTTLAFVFVQYYLIQPLINGIFDQPAVGTFTTGINHLHFAEVSATDAANWNQYHDKQHQIAANSRLTMIGKNSIFQYSKLSFADSAIDSQFNLAITMASLTTPWTRYSAYDPLADNRDPYLGCVDKNGHCTDGTPTHKADAVLTMTISDNQPSFAKDLNNLYRSTVYYDAGLEELARDRLLPTPLYSGGEVVTILSTDRIIRRPAKLGLLPSSGVKPQQSGIKQITPIILNSGQALDLSVRIPVSGGQMDYANRLTQGAADNSTAQLYGGGFGIHYSETALESDVAPFQLFSNSKLLKEFSLESSPNILIAKFSCRFPLPLGQDCPLWLAIPGPGDGRHHQGQLLISDANSRTLALPVYLNYRLISQPSVFNVNQGDLSPYRLEVINAAAERYASVELSGLPKGAQISRNECHFGLDSGASCWLEFSFANVLEPGKYLVTLSGISENGRSNLADQSQLSIEISPRF